MSFNRRERRKHIEYHVVVGGHDGDPDPQQLGRVRTRNPATHGPLVKNAHRPFVQTISPGAGMGQNEFNRPPRPGETVAILKEDDGYEYILGIVPGIVKREPKGELEQKTPELQQAADKEQQINIPPDITKELTSNRSGLQRLIKKITEKGKLDKQRLYEAIPSHGALSPLFGILYKELNQISTALTPFSQQMQSGVLQGIQGLLGNMPALGSLVSSLGSVLKNNLFGTMSGQMQGALENLLQLLPSEYELDSPGNFIFGGQQNSGSFFDNAVKALSGIQNISGLDQAFNKIMGGDESISGLSSLPGVVLSIAGPFGNILQTVLANGQISIAEDDATQALRSAFNSLVSQIPSANVEAKLFSPDTKIPEMLERFSHSAAVSIAKENYEQKDPSKKATRERLQFGQAITSGAQYLASTQSSGSGGASVQIPADNTVDNQIAIAAYDASNAAGIQAQTAIATARDSGNVASLKANIDSQVLTGTPSAPTPADGNVSTLLATTQFVSNIATQEYGITETSGNTNLLLTHAGYTIKVNASSNCFVFIPTNANVPYPQNTRIDFAQWGVGNIKFSANGTVTLRSLRGQANSAGQYSGQGLLKIGTNEWWLFGAIT